MSTLAALTAIIRDTLDIGERADALEPSSPLLGAIPELDSMAVVHLIAAIESHFDILVDDDEVSAETFESLGNLSAFVDSKLPLTRLPSAATM
jgi:acyl carrier protein